MDQGGIPDHVDTLAVSVTLVVLGTQGQPAQLGVILDHTDTPAAWDILGHVDTQVVVEISVQVVIQDRLVRSAVPLVDMVPKAILGLLASADILAPLFEDMQGHVVSRGQLADILVQVVKQDSLDHKVTLVILAVKVKQVTLVQPVM
jgi:hypothetical protein